MSRFALGAPENTAVSAPNTEVAIAYPADPLSGHTIDTIAYSLSEGTAILSLDVEDVTVFSLRVSGMGWVPVQVRSPIGAAIAVRLGAGGGAAIGRLNIIGKGAT